MKFTNRAYNALKVVALVILPAMSALYISLAGTLDLPHVEKVVGTITAIDTFLGVVLKASNSSYMADKTVVSSEKTILSEGDIAGDLIVYEDEAGRAYLLAGKEQKFASVTDKPTVTLRVVTKGKHEA